MGVPITLKDLRAVLRKSLDEFFIVEREALDYDVSERNSCQRLSMPLQRHADAAGLKGYYADVEYTRKQKKKIKTIMNASSKVITVQADLILHSRGNSVLYDNQIAIEMKKKSASETDKNQDRTRLELMTKKSFNDVWSANGKDHPEHVCGYRLGLFIILDSGAGEASLEYYENGVQSSKKTIKYRP